MKINKSKTMTFTLPEETVELLKSLAEKTNLKMSTIVKLGIEKFSERKTNAI